MAVDPAITEAVALAEQYRDQANQSEINAAASELAAQDSAGEAASNSALVSTKLALAQAAADAAQSSVDAVDAIFATVQDRYLGSSATAPIQRPDASALQVGDIYWDTVTSGLKFYDGVAWVAPDAAATTAASAASQSAIDAGASKDAAALSASQASTDADSAALSAQVASDAAATAGTYRNQASDYLTSVSGFYTMAETSADNAYSYKIDAEHAKDAAYNWAESDPFVEVNPGEYSARHYAYLASQAVAGVDGTISDFTDTYVANNIIINQRITDANSTIIDNKDIFDQYVIDNNGLVGTVKNRLDNYDLLNLDGRTTAVEDTLDILNVASVIDTVIQFPAVQADLEADREYTLGQLMEIYKTKKDVRLELAFAQRSISADINDARKAAAQERLDLVAAIDDTNAQITQLNYVAADSKSALARSVSALQVVAGNNAAAIYSEALARADEAGVLASTIEAKLAAFGIQQEDNYDPNRTYYYGQGVVYNGIGYIANAPVQGESPDTSSKWDTVADLSVATWVTDTYLEDQENLQGLIDGKIDTYYGTTDPSLEWTADEKLVNTGDLWFIEQTNADTGTTTNTTYRWDGTNWVQIQDDLAIQAQYTADGKNTIYFGDLTTRDALTTMESGDFFIDTSDNADGNPKNEYYIYNGTSWVLVRDAVVSKATADITTIETARIGYATNVNDEPFDDAGNITNKNEMDAWNTANPSNPNYPLTWQVGLPLAHVIKTLSITDGNDTGTIEQIFEIYKNFKGDITGEITFKLDTNGRVSGFGIAGSGTTGTGFSVISDKFTIVPPSDFTERSDETAPTGTADGQIWYQVDTGNSFRWDTNAWVALPNQAPFTVITTEQTFEGRTVQPGVYINKAVIGRLDAAQINVDQLAANSVFVGNYRQAAESGSSGNLAIGSSTGTGWVKTTFDNATREFTSVRAATTEGNYIYSPYIELDGGTEYTISFIAKQSSNTKDPDMYILPDDYSTVGLWSSGFWTASTDWTYKTFTFTAPANWGAAKSVRIRFDHNGSTDGNDATIYVRNVQLEQGPYDTLYKTPIADINENIGIAATTADWGQITGTIPSTVANSAVTLTSLGYLGDLNAQANDTPDIVAYGSKSFSAKGSTVTVTGGTNNSWQSAFKSRIPLTQGCYVSWKPTSQNRNYFIGLDEDPADSESYNNLAYTIYINNGVYDIRHTSNSVIVDPDVAWNLGDTFTIVFDRAVVKFYINNIVVAELDAIEKQNTPFYVDASFYQGGTTNTVIDNFIFGSLNVPAITSGFFKLTSWSDVDTAPTKLQFKTAFGRPPMDGDTVLVQDTSTPVKQKIYLYNGSTFAEQVGYFAGDILVDGTITASKIDVEDLVANQTFIGALPDVSNFITSVSWTDVNDRPTDLSDLDSTAATKLSGIETGAQVNTINSGDNLSLLINDSKFIGKLNATFIAPSGNDKTVTILNNNISVSSGTDNNWGTQVYSSEGTNTPCYASAVVNSTGTYARCMFGLNQSPATSASYTSLDYAFYLDRTNLNIYESGASIGNFGTFKTGDKLSVVYDGTNISYIHNGTTVRTVTSVANPTFHWDSSFYDINYNLDSIEFKELLLNASNLILDSVEYGATRTGGVWLRLINRTDTNPPSDADFATAFNRNPLYADILLVEDTAGNRKTYQYDGDWNEPSAVILGDMLVKGTVRADKIDVIGSQATIKIDGDATTPLVIENTAAGAYFKVATNGRIQASAGIFADGGIALAKLNQGELNAYVTERLSEVGTFTPGIDVTTTDAVVLTQTDNYCINTTALDTAPAHTIEFRLEDSWAHSLANVDTDAVGDITIGYTIQGSANGSTGWTNVTSGNVIADSVVIPNGSGSSTTETQTWNENNYEWRVTGTYEDFWGGGGYRVTLVLKWNGVQVYSNTEFASGSITNNPNYNRTTVTVGEVTYNRGTYDGTTFDEYRYGIQRVGAPSIVNGLETFTLSLITNVTPSTKYAYYKATLTGFTNNNTFDGTTPTGGGSGTIAFDGIPTLRVYSPGSSGVFTQTDADALYAPKAGVTGNFSVDGALSVTGDLNITGNINSYNVTDLDVTDKTITIGAGGTATVNDGAGIVIDGAGASLTWDNTRSKWDFNKDIQINPATVTNAVVASNNVLLVEDTEAQIQIIADDNGDWAGNLVFTTANSTSGANRHFWLHNAPSTASANAGKFELRTSTSTTAGNIGGQGLDSTVLMVADTSGNFTFTGTLSASGYNSSDWDTAYSWGDHSTEGYLTDLGWAESDDFTGTYPLAWKSNTGVLYTATWLNVNGQTDTLHTVNLEASGTVTANGATLTGTLSTNSQINSTNATIGSIGGSPTMSGAAFLAGSSTVGLGIDSNEIAYVGTGTSYINAVHDAGLEIHTGAGASNANRLTIDNDGITVNGDVSANASITGSTIATSNTADGQVVNISGVGGIYLAEGEFGIGSGDVGIHFNASGNNLLPFDTSTNTWSNGVIDLGHTDYRFNNGYFSSTVYTGGLVSSGTSKLLSNVELNVMDGYQTEGSIKIGRSDGTARYHLIKAYNDGESVANNYLTFNVHTGTVSTTVEALRLRGDAGVYMAKSRVSASYYTGGTSLESGRLRIYSTTKTGWAIGDQHGELDFFTLDNSGIGTRPVTKIQSFCEHGDGTNTTTTSGALKFFVSGYNGNVEEAVIFHSNKTSTFRNDIKIKNPSGDAKLVIARTDNSNSTASAYLDLLECANDDIADATSTGSYGFRHHYNGDNNTYYFQSTNNGTINTIFSVGRDDYSVVANNNTLLYSTDGNGRIGSSTVGLLFNNTGKSIYPWNMSTNDGYDNAIDLGIDTRAWKDVYVDGSYKMRGTTVIDSARNITGASVTSSGQIVSNKSQVTTALSTNAAIRVLPSATTDATGNSNVFLGTSIVDGYGVSLCGSRKGSDGTPTFSIRLHNNSTSGAEKLTIEDDGLTSINHQNYSYGLRVNHTSGTGYAPASILLKTNQAASRGQGIYMFSEATDTNWYTGTAYADDNANWGIHYKTGTADDNSTAATGNRVFTVGKTGDLSVSGSITTGLNKPINVKDENGTSRLILQSFATAPHGRISTSGGEQIGFYDSSTLNVLIDGAGNVDLKTGSLYVGNTSVISSARVIDNVTKFQSDQLVKGTTAAANVWGDFTASDGGARMHFSWGVAIGQSPCIKFMDGASGGDMSWTVGTNDYDNNFFIHGNETATAPDLEINESYVNKKFAFLQSGAFYAQGDITAFSDRRAKTNIETIDNALDRVVNMRGVFFNKKLGDTDKRHTGVIAQELLEHLPEAVHGSDDDGYTVSYGNIVGVLIEAIKEQQSEIDELKTLVKKLLEK